MNMNDMRQDKCNSIYSYLHKNRIATKREIAYNLNLSLPTVTKSLVRLVEQGLVYSDAKIVSKTVGRNPLAYSYIPDAKVAVGMDIAKNHIKSVVVDLDGNAIQYSHKRIEYSRTDEYFKILSAEVDEIIESAGVDKEKVLGIGLAVPGLIDKEREIVVDGRVIDNGGMSREDFSKYIHYNTKLIHDSDAAGFSEIMKMDDAENVNHVCYLSICNSFGGSVFMNNNLYHGNGLYSCEIGHLNLIPNGKKCYCGKLGCFDPYCNTEVLSSHSNNDLAAFFEQMGSGNKEFADIWETYLEHLAVAVTEIRLMFCCKIIIGGDIGSFIDEYMERLRLKVSAMSPFCENAHDFLFPCRSKKDVIATGAALHFVKEFFDNYNGDSIC